MSLPTDPAGIAMWCEELRDSCHSTQGRLVVDMVEATLEGFGFASTEDKAKIASAVNGLLLRMQAAEKARANETLEELRLRRKKGDAYVARMNKLKGKGLKVV